MEREGHTYISLNINNGVKRFIKFVLTNSVILIKIHSYFFPTLSLPKLLSYQFFFSIIIQVDLISFD